MIPVLLLAAFTLIILAQRSHAMTTSLPVTPSDWAGWVWPVPVTDGRVPTISDGFSPRAGVTINGKKFRQHLGVDILFRKRATDPKGKVKHDATDSFIAPSGTLILSAGPGKVWSAGVDSYGHWVKIDHGKVGNFGVVTRYAHLAKFSRPWTKGDLVSAGTILGEMGYSPANDSEQLRHLHFEMIVPRDGVPQSEWTEDPSPFMRHWRKVLIPESNS